MTQIFLLGTLALIPLLGGFVLLWRRYYREDSADLLRTVAKNSALPIAANLLNKVLDFGFAAIALRLLGPVFSGAYDLVALIVGLFLLTLTNWGLNDLTVREAATDLGRAPRLFSVTLLLRWGISLATVPLAIALAAGYAIIGNPLLPAAQVALALLVIHLFPAALAAACSASFQAYQRMEIPALLGTLTTIVKTLVGAALLFALPDASSRLVALAGLALGATSINAALFWLLQRRLLFSAPLVWSWQEGRALLREAFPLLLNSLLLAVFFRFDIIILRALRGDGEVGLYGAAYKLINMTQILPPYLVAALFPLLSRYAATDRAALRRLFFEATRLLQLIAWPVAAATTVLASDLIWLLGGAGYLPGAASALAILIWYLPLSYLNGVVQYVLIAIRRQRAITVAFVVGALVNLALNAALIPRYGAAAAAVATIVTEIALLLPFLRALAADELLPPIRQLIWRPALAALLMLGAMLASHGLGPLAAALIGAAVYCAALALCNGFGETERRIAGRLRARLR